MSDDDDAAFSLDSVFTEAPRPPTPPATTAIYTRENEDIDDDDWHEVHIRLVGSHPLWGHYLWNASRAFAAFLDQNPALYRGRCVLELGAGGGLPGLVAALNGAHKAVLTDYPDKELLENLESNVKTNIPESAGRVVVQGYIWGQPVEPLLAHAGGAGFDLIILSDLVFNHSQHDALLTTCERALSDSPSPDNPPCVLVFYTHHRPQYAARDLAFFARARARGWACAEVLTRRYPPMFPEDPGEEEVRATVHGWRLARAAR
ncbi:hypothetical protein GLOTRDRAFT_117322 [Gloeophyllum trabeum ATCC 11539]|uniref:Protein N-terminal and lysine N-methyltransferase EFM7 n=1 Tax=Gloeophyllum trabeum (strain ATCC 11539 / FP-39264 / Madison 617) TaxID=670483 RepID=S7Q0T0_GLOTA|nr:uncharacterized protein GLOTRDRAFT_117322 [Gloeophyllum trabeum ATCC 11539]EPQ53373.1 hypothetical protein GLOTRDRAFT_117322 [Gloeophyllum trabeum ATCC 11539]